MKLLWIALFAITSLFSMAQESPYSSTGRSSYDTADYERLERAINVQSPDISEQDIMGTWAYSGSGCRAPSLEPDTHRTEASEFGMLVSSLALIFDGRGGVTMSGVIKDEAALLRGQEKLSNITFKARYHLSGNSVSMDSWQAESMEFAERHTYVVDGRLIVSDISLDGLQSCGLEHVAVLVFSKVD